MPDGGTLSPTLDGTPDTFRIAPTDTTPVRCFDSRKGKCREVKFVAFGENTTVIVIGDADGNATSGNARGVELGAGAVHIEPWIDPYDWYVGTDGDSTNGVSVTVTK